MTIRELCDKYICDKCPFTDACDFWSDIPHNITDEDDMRCTKSIIETARRLQDNKLSNADWINFLSMQFNVSRRSARKMLHGMITIKRFDNFNKQFNGSRRKVTNND